jgi:hypothetical protein
MCVMKHLLMDPAFPDLVAQAATAERESELRRRRAEPEPRDPAEAFLNLLARLEVASTRLW